MLSCQHPSTIIMTFFFGKNWNGMNTKMRTMFVFSKSCKSGGGGSKNIVIRKERPKELKYKLSLSG